MKSRTSCFKTAVKKDLTRFAPAWVGYLICLLMGLVLIWDAGSDFGPARAFPELIQLMSVINLFYALLTSQLLFGDLFNSRMCYGLHTLPLRREGWFAAHALSGVLFSLIPTAIMTAISVVMCIGSTIEQGWQLPLYFLVGTNLEYLFFFGVGALSMLLAANRFGGAIVYGIVNFASILVYYVVDTVYVPLLYGFVSSEDIYVFFSPVVQMVELPYFELDTYNVFQHYALTGEPIYARCGTFSLTESWWYLWGCAGLGLAAMGAALLLYRRRDLERAGDLLAVKAMEPVFGVVFSIVCATVFHFVAQGMFGYGENFVLMFVGLAVGWFFGRMLLQRTTRVFGLKAWLKLAALTALVVMTVVATHFDILGLERKIPKLENIESVTVRHHRYSDPEMDVVLTEEADIENILYIHTAALETRLDSERLWYNGAEAKTIPEDVNWDEVQRSVPVYITYKLSSGRTVTRYYYIWGHMPEGQLLKGYMSRLKAVIGMEELYYSPVQDFSINGWELPAEHTSREDMEELLEALELDFAAGTMAQDASFHPLEPVMVFENQGGKQKVYNFWINLDTQGYHVHMDIYADAVHTVEWIRSRDIDDFLMESEG